MPADVIGSFDRRCRNLRRYKLPFNMKYTAFFPSSSHSDPSIRPISQRSFRLEMLVSGGSIVIVLCHPCEQITSGCHRCYTTVWNTCRKPKFGESHVATTLSYSPKGMLCTE